MLSSIFLAHQCNTHDLAILTSRRAKDVVFSIWRLDQTKEEKTLPIIWSRAGESLGLVVISLVWPGQMCV